MVQREGLANDHASHAAMWPNTLYATGQRRKRNALVGGVTEVAGINAGICFQQILILDVDAPRSPASGFNALRKASPVLKHGPNTRLTAGKDRERP
jgi:hypothetical protein